MITVQCLLAMNNFLLYDAVELLIVASSEYYFCCYFCLARFNATVSIVSVVEIKS